MSKLKRSLSWKVFALYGLGNILGAGIYVLVGEVAGKAGSGLLWSFVIAAIVATFTALTYSALAAKYPVSAGAAVYTERAFKSQNLSTLIGLSLAFTGVVSASTLLRGFYRYFDELFTGNVIGAAPEQAVILTILLLLGVIAYKGIKESAAIAVFMTLLEVGGLILIIGFAGLNGNIGGALQSSFNFNDGFTALGLLLGAFLAFYAFIGFEDMINLAEEVKEPKKNLKKGMVGALVMATVLYLLVAIASLAVLSPAELTQSNAPLSDVFKAASNSNIPVITIIGLFAVINGVLAQIIMSSRVLYGMGREGWIPKFFSQVSAKTKTPVNATLISLSIIALGALTLPLGTLAKITSMGLLIIFTIVQTGAIKLILQRDLKLHIAIPTLGILTNIGIIAIQVIDWLN